MNLGLTEPIHVGEIKLGVKEANVLPFECADFDFNRINEYLSRNPACRVHVIPDALVSSCSECCMESINGKPNTLGVLFRKSRAGKGCCGCPVSIASERLPARAADGSYVRSASGRILSESEVVNIAADGTA